MSVSHTETHRSVGTHSKSEVVIDLTTFDRLELSSPNSPSPSVLGTVADIIPMSCVDGPGNRMVVFMQGCNFDCVACHNPQTIAEIEPGHGPERMHLSVDDVMTRVRRTAPFLSGITVSGGEATRQPEFVYSLFTSIKTDPTLSRLTCFVDSNGSCDAEVWDRLAPVLDGAMIDLKCLDDTIHQSMTGQSNAAVLKSIRHLDRMGKLYEVRLLILAGVNDNPNLVRRTAEWLAALDPQMRIKVIGFRSHGVRPHEPILCEPTPESLAEVRDTLQRIAPFDVSVI